MSAERKATIVTFDSDFGRFPGVRWRRPDAVLDTHRDLDSDADA